MRVFPLSNWTELDVWQYIEQEQLALPNIYFSHPREVVRRDGQWLPVSDLLTLKPREEVREGLNVRVRTIGDITCTGCIESEVPMSPASSPRSPPPASPSAAAAPTTSAPRPPWKTASAKAISKET
jgi:3'-phosphoadenosine 5'-phosphosulfate sulfotransferase (PAPS reductase)/FAD synthetase